MSLDEIRTDTIVLRLPLPLGGMIEFSKVIRGGTDRVDADDFAKILHRILKHQDASIPGYDDWTWGVNWDDLQTTIDELGNYMLGKKQPPLESDSVIPASSSEPISEPSHPPIPIASP